MAKTETTVNNLKINRGTYAAIQANLASIGENELIITTDKTLPIPQATDAGKVISVSDQGEYTLQPTSPSGVTSVGIINGGGLTVSGSPITSSGSITVAHADTSSQASVDNSGRTYIQDVTLDEYGHVTGLASATETVVDTNTTYTLNVSGTGDNKNKVGLVAGGSGSGTTWYTIPYAACADKPAKIIIAMPMAEVSGSYVIVTNDQATRYYFIDATSSDISNFPNITDWMSSSDIQNFAATNALVFWELLVIDNEGTLTPQGFSRQFTTYLEAVNDGTTTALYNFCNQGLDPGMGAYLTFTNSDLTYKLIVCPNQSGAYAYGLIETFPVIHNHGNITSDGKIGTAADKVITTSTGGLLVANSTLPTAVTQASLANLPTWTANPTDSTYLVRRDTGGSATYGQVTFLTIWNYISGKIGNITASDTTKKIYTTGTTGSGTSDVANRYYDPNIYRPANNAGMLVADKFSTSESAYMTYDSTEEAIKFVFA